MVINSIIEEVLIDTRILTINDLKTMVIKERINTDHIKLHMTNLRTTVEAIIKTRDNVQVMINNKTIMGAINQQMKGITITVEVATLTDKITKEEVSETPMAKNNKQETNIRSRWIVKDCKTKELRRCRISRIQWILLLIKTKSSRRCVFIT